MAKASSVVPPPRESVTPQGERQPRAGVTFRSVVLGLLGVLFVCGLTPYNDYVLNNTNFVGNYVPIGLLLYFAIVLFLINLPLARFRPRAMFQGRELAVALGMTLVGCGLPSSGLMRFLPATLVGVHYQASVDPNAAQVLTSMHLPDWLFPSYPTKDVLGRARDPITTDFIGRVQLENRTFLNELRAVPWSAWVRPMLAWGILFGALFSAVLCLSAIVRRQWVENEHLPFPLAGVFVSMIESPAPGRRVNTLFASRLFWTAFLSVMAIHLVNGLSAYYPRYIPGIPLQYNFHGLMSEGAWQYMDGAFKNSTIYFSVIGVNYFLQTKVAFSLWFFFVLRQIMNVAYGLSGAQQDGMALSDQVFGAMFAVAGTILWVGRHHWSVVLRAMFGRRRDTDEADPYLPYPLAGWGLLIFSLAAIIWLTAAGVTVFGSVLLVLMILTLYLVMARVVAETGLIYATIGVWFLRPWSLGLQWPSVFSPTTTPTVFFTTFLNASAVVGARESVSVYATHALKVNDDVAEQPLRFGVMGALVLALVVGYLSSAGSTLFVEYNHASSLSKNAETPINWLGVINTPQSILSITGHYQPPTGELVNRHSVLGNILLGAGVTVVLSWLRLRFTAWPLHPVGYLLWQSWPLAAVWFSIFLGWLCKVVILKFGGGSLYRAVRPVFIGLILGEAGAAAVWCAVSLILSYAGYTYIPIRLLPG